MKSHNRNIGVIPLPVERLHLELTNTCNFSCEFCPDSRMTRKRGMMPLETAQSIIDEAAKKGIARLFLFHVMGEPTLYPHLVDVIQHASNRGMATCLTTNGSRLDEELLDELVDAGIGKIILSLQTPDEKTFSLRGARGISFDEYAERIAKIAKRFLSDKGDSTLSLEFLSSPLRRLIIPVFPEVSIADTSSDLKKHLMAWAKRILNETSRAQRYDAVHREIQKIWTFKENTVKISNRLRFHTRVMGDWSIHFDQKNVNALVGFCPGIRENFGILWNGDYTFCCTDFDGRTSLDNYHRTSLEEYLGKKEVQDVVKGFNRFQVKHPYCKQCLGDRNFLNAAVKQIGSIFYFKWLRKKIV